MAPMPPLDRVRVVRAWAVHVFTMTGVVWACLAALALFEGQLALMWLWLGVALIVDGVDGTLARKAEVKTYAPGFDGAVVLWLMDTGAAFTVTVTVALAVLTVAPLAFIHPFRVRRLMAYNVVATLGWTAMTAILIVQRPDADPIVQALWWACGGWLMLVSLVRTVSELRRRSSAARGSVPA